MIFPTPTISHGESLAAQNILYKTKPWPGNGKSIHKSNPTFLRNSITKYISANNQRNLQLYISENIPTFTSI